MKVCRRRVSGRAGSPRRAADGGGASNFRNCEFIKEIDWQTTECNPLFIYITLAVQRLLRVFQNGVTASRLPRNEFTE